MHLTDRRPRLSSFIVFSMCVAAGVATATASVQALANQDGPPRRAGETSTTLADGRVLIAGGDENGTGEIYDPATDQTTPLAARLNGARAYHRAVLLGDGNVLILGGYAAGAASVERSAEVFSPATGGFEKVAGAMQSERVQPAVTVRADGVVQIAGGDAAGSEEFFDPVTQTFGPDPAAPLLTTDRLDYAPGETVTFAGRRWAAGEEIRLLLEEEPAQHGSRELLAMANESGEFVNTDFAPEEHDLGVTFHVTATGLTSGLQARWTFTDGAPSSTGYAISSSTGSLSTGGTDTLNYCDDCVTPIALPFPVTIYDQTFTAATVSSNGSVQLTAPFTAEYRNGALPASAFGLAILPYWDDLRTDRGGGIFTQTRGVSPNRVFRIRFEGVYYACLTCDVRFELLLYESLAQFDVIYGALGSSGSATIGVQRNGNGAATWYLNSASVGALAAGTVLRFSGVPLHPTATALTSSANPSVFGQATTLTATVTGDGSRVTNGAVTFAEGATILSGPIALDSSGQATFRTAFVSTGSHVITATYTCASTWASSSAAVTQTVNQAGTATAVTPSVNPAVFGQPVTFTVAVAALSPGRGIPGGTVQFQADGMNLEAPVPIVNGSAALVVSSLSSGNHTIAAAYSGDGGFGRSSGTVSYDVRPADTTTTVVSTVNPSVYREAASFVATVDAVAPGSGTPSGLVQFRDNGNAVGAAVGLSSGRARLALATLAAGSHAITADYWGDSSFNGSTSVTMLQTVNKAAATVSLSNLSHTFDGAPKGAIASTDPAGLAGVSIMYNGSPAPPSDAGTYTVVASLNNANYVAADATATLVIDRAGQTITFSPLGEKSYGDPAFSVDATASSGLPVTFSASGSCSVSGTEVTIVSGGLCTVTAAQAGGRNYDAAPSVSRQFTVAYTWSNLLRPVSIAGTSIFKLGSTVPVKFQLTGASAALTNLHARLFVAPMSSSVLGSELEAESTSGADSGNTFRYDGSSGQYVFNLATKALAQGTWQIRIDLQDGSMHSVLMSLK